MALKDVDIGSALRRLADLRIEEAMRQGKFDNLPGAGQPLDLEPMPAEEDARMTWWALRILRRNDFIPDEVRWRKQLDQLRATLAATRDESALPPLVAAINHLVHRINTLGTNALRGGVAPVNLEQEHQRIRQAS